MCVLFIGHLIHPDFPLVVAANRDEFHERPTAACAPWPPDLFGKILYAGKDLVGLGTWMGVTSDARFAAVTNFRGLKGQPLKGNSRGKLVTEALYSDAPVGEFLTKLKTTGDNYAGFNLLVLTGAGTEQQTLGYYSNAAGEAKLLPPGVYGLSNGLLESNWPKVANGRAHFAALIDAGVNHEHLFSLLADRSPAEDSELPDTGIGLERERFLSPLFIQSDRYGTRSSSVLRIASTGDAEFWERSFNAGGETLETVSLRFSCGSSLGQR